MRENATDTVPDAIPLSYRRHTPKGSHVNQPIFIDGRTLVWALSGGFALFGIVFFLVILPRSKSIGCDARIGQAKEDISAVTTALDTFEADVGRYPTSSEGLAALTTAPSNVAVWQGPYLPKPITLDPWGRPYMYVTPGKHNPRGFDLSSAGRDGRFGTADDVDNWMVGQ